MLKMEQAPCQTGAGPAKSLYRSRKCVKNGSMQQRIICPRRSQRGGIIGTLVFLVFAGAVLILLPQYTLGLLSAALVVDEEPRAADAIVILLNPGAPARTITAAQLYREGFASRIVFASGEDLVSQLDTAPPGFKWNRSSDANLIGLASISVPREDIVIIEAPEAFDTAHELEAVADYARQEKWRSVLLVTSASHTRRSRMIWRRLAPHIDAITVAAPQRGFDRWWSNGRGRKAVFYEYGALTKELVNRVAAFLGDVLRTAHERRPKAEGREQKPRREEAQVRREVPLSDFS